ncbi:hypothetical protein [Nonomuraea sp. B19D2]|uniref:hypothetical protein n=1 Tax=Nonomuraea sp. B19D2 TaxID=3159561 RepID=UPI0032D9B81E
MARGKALGRLLAVAGALALIISLVVGAGTVVRSAAAVAFGLGASILAITELVLVTRKRKAHDDA